MFEPNTVRVAVTKIICRAANCYFVEFSGWKYDCMATAPPVVVLDTGNTPSARMVRRKPDARAPGNKRSIVVYFALELPP